MHHEEEFLGPELNQLTAWVSWMRDTLDSELVDLPSPEMCVEFVRAALVSIREIERVHKELPNELRDNLIEASLVHQCWKRQIAIRRNGATLVHRSPIIVVDAVDLVRRTALRQHVMTASDGYEYEVRFPGMERICTLATEVIASEFARSMSIPVPPLALVNVNSQLALRAGANFGYFRMAHKAKSIHDSNRASPCIGVRCSNAVELEEHRKREFPIGTSRLLIGVTVFNILALNTIPQGRSFRQRNGRAEPVFTNFSHCFFDSDWPRFLKANARDQCPSPPLTNRLPSYDQLEAWIRRAEQVDLDRICEIAVKLPGGWYNNRPGMIAAVVEKLHDRLQDLRKIVREVVRSDYFGSRGTEERESVVAIPGHSRGGKRGAVARGVAY